MSSLVNTALAAVTTDGKDSFLYYQSGQEIREAHSASGTSWTAVASTVATNASFGGSALTAYYVKQDGDFGGKSTIHVVYLDPSARVAEKVKVISEGTWKDGQSTGITKNPVSTSRITGGSFNGNTGWNPNGSQWVYFNTPDGDQLQVTEIRRIPKSPWYTETVLPENTQALPGTDLASSIVSGTIDLYYQDHGGNINHWVSQDSKWIDKKVLVPSSEVQISTPLATVNADKKHLIYVDKSSPAKIKDYVEGKSVDVANFYPGTRLAALSVNGKLTVFYKILNPAGAIATKVYDGSSWKDGTTVVPA
ncbi:protein kinase ssp1 [Aspergillus hancockii]|nr:protein kinase ssp1 [Aspergillus hancockii]